MARTSFIGIAFPFKRSTTSLPASVTDNDLIRQSLAQIVLTGRGERVMRPSFGSNAYAFVFENNSQIFQESVRADIMNAIGKFETRVIVQSVDVTRDDTEAFVEISYVVLATRQEQSIKITIPIA